MQKLSIRPKTMPQIRDLGDLFLPQPVKSFLEIYLVGNDRTLIYITFWSVVHFFSGMLTAQFLTPSPWAAFWIHTAWEILQLVIKNTPWTARGFIDIAMDTALFMGGFLAYLQVTRDE